MDAYTGMRVCRHVLLCRLNVYIDVDDKTKKRTTRRMGRWLCHDTMIRLSFFFVISCRIFLLSLFFFAVVLTPCLLSSLPVYSASTGNRKLHTCNVTPQPDSLVVIIVYCSGCRLGRVCVCRVGSDACLFCLFVCFFVCCGMPIGFFSYGCAGYGFEVRGYVELRKVKMVSMAFVYS